MVGEELLREFLDSIDCPVIVEGRKDQEALKRLGVEDIVLLNNGRPLYETVESLQGVRKVAVLTDMDQTGKHLRRRLLKLMGMYGITENRKPREIFAKMRVGCVEGIESPTFGLS